MFDAIQLDLSFMNMLFLDMQVLIKSVKLQCYSYELKTNPNNWLGQSATKICLECCKRKPSKMFPDGPLSHGYTCRLVVVAADPSDVDPVAVATEEVFVDRKLFGFVEILNESYPKESIASLSK
jgi:hypothetical protein